MSPFLFASPSSSVSLKFAWVNIYVVEVNDNIKFPIYYPGDTAAGKPLNGIMKINGAAAYLCFVSTRHHRRYLICQIARAIFVITQDG